MNDEFLSVDDLEFKNKNKFSKSTSYSIITGGAGRIGSVYTSVLLKKGFNVIIASRTNNLFLKYKSSLEKNYQEKIEWMKLDLTKLDSVRKFASRVSKRNIFHLINNASLSNRGQFFKYNEKNIVKENLGVNLGSIFLTERIVTLMRKKKTGRIIFTGSLWGSMTPRFDTYLEMNNGPSALIASGKASIEQYAKYIAVREAVNNIKVNILLPGWFPRKGRVERKDYINKILHNIPMSRIGNLKDLIKPIEFLLSEENDYMTGQSLIIDGGYSLY
jgi:NAD(P)-dependent dehydrogenase (short-subunit alcohol dehydrogenase family)